VEFLEVSSLSVKEGKNPGEGSKIESLAGIKVRWFEKIWIDLTCQLELYSDYLKPQDSFSPTWNKKKAFASSKPPPFVPIATKLATTSLSNRDTIFCGQTSLRSSCDTTAELHIFYLKVISKILSVYNFFFAWQQDNDVGLLRRVLGAWFVLVLWHYDWNNVSQIPIYRMWPSTNTIFDAANYTVQQDKGSTDTANVIGNYCEND
jgi:hypothetical protein